MARAEKFNVQDDVLLEFESGGNKFRMKLLVSSGLVIIEKLNGTQWKHFNIMWLGEVEPYHGETKEEIKAIEENPKKKKKKSTLGK